MSESEQAEWYYVGHYGQLGPLSLQNMAELAADGVIERDTYVWNPKMPDWEMAANVPALTTHFIQSQTPPPPPTPGSRMSPQATSPFPQNPSPPLRPINASSHALTPYGGSQWMLGPMSAPRSDKNRLTAALLNFLPGFGRLYLGHTAIGVLQLLTTPCGGFLWSWIDGVYILAGGVKHDGYGRELPD
ncbi:MAG: GYF domain-containing protein [Fimbriimonadaceae bacterium]